MTNSCGVCGTVVDHSEKFCTSCGAEVTPSHTVTNTQHTPPNPSFQTQPRQPKKLYRCCCDTVAGGVCAGLAEHMNTDVNIIRLVTVILALFTSGTVAIAYIVAWAVLPVEPIELHKSRSQTSPMQKKQSL